MNETYLEIAKQKVSDHRLLINGASHRAAELARGGRPLIPVSPGEQEMDYLDIALKEIAEGKIVIRPAGEAPVEQTEEETQS